MMTKMVKKEKNKIDFDDDIRNVLSEREIEILKMIVEEMTNAETAKKITLSSRTIDSHRWNITRKLKAKNTAGFVRAAIRGGIID